MLPLAAAAAPTVASALAPAVGAAASRVMARTFLTRVHTGTVKTKEVFGKYKAVLEPGLHFYIPFVTEISPELSTRVELIDVQSWSKTKDGAFASVDIQHAVRMRANEEDVCAFVYNIDDFKEILTARTMNLIRSTTSQVTLDQLFESEHMLVAEVEETLHPWASKYGVTVESTSVVSITPEAAVRKAMNAVLIADREREATLHAAEAERLELVARAEAEKQRKELQGEGIAAMRQAIMAGYNRSVAEFVAASGVDATEAARIATTVDYLDTLRQMAREGGVIFMPYGPSSDALGGSPPTSAAHAAAPPIDPATLELAISKGVLTANAVTDAKAKTAEAKAAATSQTS